MRPLCRIALTRLLPLDLFRSTNLATPVSQGSSRRISFAGPLAPALSQAGALLRIAPLVLDLFLPGRLSAGPLCYSSLVGLSSGASLFASLRAQQLRSGRANGAGPTRWE
jgi:hypothetical protein